MKQQGRRQLMLIVLFRLRLFAKKKKVNLILVAVSSGCYSAGVGLAEEDVEFNRFLGFTFSTLGGTQVAPFGFMWRVSWMLLVYQML